MFKKILFVILVLGCMSAKSSLYVKTVDYKSDYLYWSYMTEDDKIKAIFNMVIESDGLAKFKIDGNVDSISQDSLVDQVFQQVRSVEKCVDTLGVRLYHQCNKDLSIGEVMINCIEREGLTK